MVREGEGKIARVLVIDDDNDMPVSGPDCGRHDGYLKRYLETDEKKVIGDTREGTGRSKDGTAFPLDLDNPPCLKRIVVLGSRLENLQTEFSKRS